MDKLLPLPLSKWEDTKITLHLFLQIVGKIRLALHPKRNHWWHVTFTLTPRGLTTGPIPYQNGLFAIDFDFLSHELIIQTSNGERETFALDQISVANFYKNVFSILKKFGIRVTIFPKPFDPKRVKSQLPFPKDDQHAAYDKVFVTHYWKILVFIYPIFAKFAGQFIGKETPIHLFWHTMDLAVSRFSNRKAPLMPNADPVTREAYSHEVISFGFWAGDDNMPEPAFYSYTHPEPKGLNEESLQPDRAYWKKANGTSLAILDYHDLIEAKDPRKNLLAFLQSAYHAGAKLAKWDTSLETTIPK